MSTRGIVLSAGPALTLVSKSARAQPPDEVVALFAISQVDGLRTDTKTLALCGISPQTIFFCDRPERVAGNMTRRFRADLERRQDSLRGLRPR